MVAEYNFETLPFYTKRKKIVGVKSDKLYKMKTTVSQENQLYLSVVINKKERKNFKKQKIFVANIVEMEIRCFCALFQY